jgi:hypothetical protein
MVRQSEQSGIGDYAAARDAGESQRPAVAPPRQRIHAQYCQGFQCAALPPYKIEGSVTTTRPVLAPRFIHRGYYVAPYYTRLYLGLRPWGSPWVYDSLYYDRYYTYWRTHRSGRAVAGAERHLAATACAELCLNLPSSSTQLGRIKRRWPHADQPGRIHRVEK